MNSKYCLLFILVLFSARLNSGTNPTPDIAVASYTFHTFTVFEAIERAAQCGIGNLETFTNQALSPSDPTKIYALSEVQLGLLRAHLKKHNVKIVSCMGAVPTDETKARIFFEAAQKLGARNIGTDSIDSIETIEKIIDDYDLTVAFHNHSRNPAKPEYRNYDPRFMLEKLKGRHPRIGVCADTGHWATSGVIPLEGIKLLEGRIKSLHLKDRSAIGHRTPDQIYGTGVLDVAGQLAELRRQRFDGIVVIEYENNPRNNISEVTQCAEFLKRHLAEEISTPTTTETSTRSGGGLASLPPIEDAAARAALPEYFEIPAAPLDTLTPANGWPAPDSYRQWHRSHGGPTSNRFSALDQINRDNVRKLEVAWTYRSGDGTKPVQANPIVVNGVIFAPTAGRNVVALDAASGRELWRFSPDQAGGADAIPARRGLLYWPGDAEVSPRLLFPCGRWIYALDPKTGKAISDFGENGRTALPAGGAVGGAVYKRTYVIPGYTRDVFGYDVGSGRMLWKFNTIPEPDEFGGDTWKTRVQPRGANCWSGMVLDESRGIAYFATGSPKANFSGSMHLGDNLFANCVLALDAETGRRLWHFQEIRHDIWDLDIASPPNLVTVMHRGRLVDAVAQVTKVGNVFLLDRVTGKPLFPVRMRRAPVSRLPGEKTSPYQPDPELPEPVWRQDFRREDITDRTPEARAAVEQKVANASMGFYQPVDYVRPTVYYGLLGGTDWPGSAFDPRTGFLYVAANHTPFIITLKTDEDPPPAVPATAGELIYRQFCIACHGAEREGVGMAPPLRALRQRMNDQRVLEIIRKGQGAMPPLPLQESQLRPLLDFLMARDRGDPSAVPTTRLPQPLAFDGYKRLLDHENYPGSKPPWGTLNCIDLNTGRIRWRVPLGEYEALTRAGIAKTGTENLGGATVTAGGLVFCGGTKDKTFRAFDSTTGEELWAAPLPSHGTTPPTVYEVDGRQFVIIGTSGGGHLASPASDAWIAFALPAALYTSTSLQ
ncbi:MAG TPA: PQQ-binding-like beta-propeller repeat protein [Opitutaceae bacterium]|nr:PQQ-binding-like beta-propeller repeat protein [Opitutaceae bacterium]